MFSDETIISVEIREKVCRGLELYPFFTSGNLLDAPEWDERNKDNDDGGQHDADYFNIALALAEYISK